MPDNLNSEEIDIDKIINAPEGESLEGVKTDSSETSETGTEAPKAEPEPATPDTETIELIKSIREEVGEKRFNGIMSAWQRDKSDLKKYQEKDNAPKPTEQGQDDALIEYLDKKLEEKRSARERAIQEAVNKEVDEARTMYPQFTEQQLLETANKLSVPGRPASLMTAAIHLAEIDQAVNAKGQMTAEEIEKKKKAGIFAGRSGVQTSGGIKKYDPEKDGKKSIGELIDEGFGE